MQVLHYQNLKQFRIITRGCLYKEILDKQNHATVLASDVLKEKKVAISFRNTRSSECTSELKRKK